MQDSPVLAAALEQFHTYKALAEKSLAQVAGDEKFFCQIDAESNSVALILKHLAGNLRSRWRDFLSTDGEKTDRDRDGEFVTEATDSRAILESQWQEAWAITFGSLEKLSDKDLLREVRIRGEPHTVLKAINRNLTHLAYHVGQITFLAKHLVGQRWQTLSTPRNRNRYMEPPAKTTEKTTRSG
jgi:hypothetical protein